MKKLVTKIVMAFAAAVVIVLTLQHSAVDAKVVGAVVMPHGGIALDPSHFLTNDSRAMAEAWDVHEACSQAGKLLGEMQPDLVLLSTPHGIADLNSFSFYLGSQGIGSADTDNCACPPCCYNVSVQMGKEQALSFISVLKQLTPNVSGMVGFGDAEPFPLKWGEVIPLHFAIPYLPRETCVIVLSQPNRRYTDSVSMIPELLTLGMELFALLEPLSQRVALIISADLAHTHLASGPYGFSNASQPFDDAIGEWASSLDSSYLLKIAAGLVDEALSCGYTGLVMLQGLIEAMGPNLWSSDLLVNYHPSYYGMMVATFKSNTVDHFLYQ